MFNMDSAFLKMVIDMLTNGLRNYTYQLRANTLSEIFPLKPLMINHYVLESTTEVGSLARKLFKDWPSISETTRCEKCNYELEKHLTAVQIEDLRLKSSSMETFVQEFCTTSEIGYCTKCFPENTPKEHIKCTVKNTLTKIGKTLYYYLNLQYIVHNN